jgi:hypothetical protein
LAEADKLPEKRGRRLFRFGNVDPKGNGLSPKYIQESLKELTGGWPCSCYGSLFVPAATGGVLWLDSVNELFAWIYGQLPDVRAHRVAWEEKNGKVTKGEFHAHLLQAAQPYDAVEDYPHCPVLPGHYYAHRALGEGDGKALDEFLSFFSPATALDRQLLKSLILTLIWGGPPGQRPVFLITVEDSVQDHGRGRGSGKSSVARIVSRLVGGCLNVCSSQEMDGIIRRLLSGEARGRRLVLLDNVKSLRFSWSDLEGLITAEYVSGHRMYKGEGRRPNTLVWVITMNGGSLSKDMAQRAVMIKVNRPGTYDPEWEPRIEAFLKERHWDVLADAVAELKRSPVPLQGYSRWAQWEANVLSKCDDPDACRQLILDRQTELDADDEETALVREAFAAFVKERVRSAGKGPSSEEIFIRSEKALEIVNSATGEKYAAKKLKPYLAGLGIPELKYHRTAEGRGYLWKGDVQARTSDTK